MFSLIMESGRDNQQEGGQDKDTSKVVNKTKVHETHYFLQWLYGNEGKDATYC